MAESRKSRKRREQLDEIRAEQVQRAREREALQPPRPQITEKPLPRQEKFRVAALDLQACGVVDGVHVDLVYSLPEQDVTAALGETVTLELTSIQRSKP